MPNTFSALLECGFDQLTVWFCTHTFTVGAAVAVAGGTFKSSDGNTIIREENTRIRVLNDGEQAEKHLVQCACLDWALQEPTSWGEWRPTPAGGSRANWL